MYCMECGKNVPNGAKFCPECGHQVVREQDAPFIADSAVCTGGRISDTHEALTETAGTSTERKRREEEIYQKDSEKAKKTTGKIWLYLWLSTAVVIFMLFLVVVINGAGKTTQRKEASSGTTQAGHAYSSVTAEPAPTAQGRLSSTPRPTPKPSYTAPGKDNISSALFVLAEQQVKANLKAPGTATMCQWRDTIFQEGSDGVYIMTGWVDAQNSYGASIRETWGIMAQLDGGKLVMLMLQIGDDIVYP